MPELPEVETTCRALAQCCIGHTISGLECLSPRLRYPLDATLQAAVGQKVCDVKRRAKYIYFVLERGYIVCHFGMSGFFRWDQRALKKHDHVLIHFPHTRLIYNDPRRFGFMLWSVSSPCQALWSHLGPEPLSDDFNLSYILSHKLTQSRLPIKVLLMDARWVVGIGNIYASEVLFLAGISPETLAKSLQAIHWQALLLHIKKILAQAIDAGGCSIKNFAYGDKLGYFSQSLQVYGRGNQPCMHCHTLLVSKKIGQRSSVYCPQCQPCL